MLGAMVFLFVLASLGASPAGAEFRIGVDRNTLYGWCRTNPGGVPNQPVGGYRAGFIHGVVDVHGEKTTIYGCRTCLPISVTIRRMRKIVVTWLENHPDRRDLLAHGLVGQALSEALPCP